MNETILWKDYFNLKISEFRLTDWTFKIEARIQKVTINQVLTKVNTPTLYGFNIWLAFLNCGREDLFDTKEAAKYEATQRINKIEILIIDDIEEKNKKEEKKKADAEWSKQS